MHLHLLHLIRVQLLLDPLRERGRQATPRRGLAAPIVRRRRERIVHAQVRRKAQLFRRGRRRAVRDRRGRGQRRAQRWRGRVAVAEQGRLFRRGRARVFRVRGLDRRVRRLWLEREGGQEGRRCLVGRGVSAGRVRAVPVQPVDVVRVGRGQVGERACLRGGFRQGVVRV